MGPGTQNTEAIRTAGRKEEEAVVISAEDLGRVLLDTNDTLNSKTYGVLDLTGVIPLLRDMKSGAELLQELGLRGSYYTKEINGRTYVILRGYAGLRRVLSASRYLTMNPKVIAYGLTRAAAIADSGVNIIITIVVLVPLEILRGLMGEQTLSQVFGNILSGTLVAALASAATFGAAALLALTTWPAWAVVGGTIIVGLLISKLLSDLADTFNISGFVSMALDDAVRHLAEEEDRKAREQYGRGLLDRNLPADSGWRGLFGPRW